jgi:uncharacterized protein YigE (DUF2233 family)
MIKMIEMEAAKSSHGITNYMELFTGKFGQTGEPTLSNVNVTTDAITITNATTGFIDVLGIKNIESIGLYVLSGKRMMKNTNSSQINGSLLPNGIYLIHIKSGNHLFVEQVVVKK